MSPGYACKVNKVAYTFSTPWVFHEIQRHKKGPEHHSLSPWRSTMKAPQAPQQSFSGTAPEAQGKQVEKHGLNGENREAITSRR